MLPLPQNLAIIPTAYIYIYTHIIRDYNGKNSDYLRRSLEGHSKTTGKTKTRTLEEVLTSDVYS